MKNFFKLNKFKARLSIAFFLIFNIVPIIPCMKGSVSSLETMTNLHFGFCTPIGIRGVGIYDILGLNFLGYEIDSIVAYLYIIIISYILSSLIFSFSKKYVKKV
jgi:hypothetical protein